MKTTRREFLGMLGFAVGTTAAFGVCGKLPAINPEKPISRPPGVLDEDEFLQKCMRCKQCVYICQTAAEAGKVLHPMKLTDGFNVVNTPVKIEEDGKKCTGCGLCKNVCPSGAIGGGAGGKAVPQVAADLCVGCFKCVIACPTGALTEGENGYPSIDPEPCTSCASCVNACEAEGQAKDADGNHVVAIGLVPETELVELPDSNPNRKKAQIDEANCQKCAARPCFKACNYDAISYADKQSPSHVDPDKCVGCGACAEACPFDVIELV